MVTGGTASSGQCRPVCRGLRAQTPVPGAGQWLGSVAPTDARNRHSEPFRMFTEMLL